MRYSHEIASSLSSTAHAVPLLPHGRRLSCVVDACDVGDTVGRKCVRYSNEQANSLSSTARAVPLLPHGRRLRVVCCGYADL